ncbi:unnamed protein product, partial [Laminaria digitata]
WGTGRGRHQDEGGSIFRSRGGSWDSDPRDGFEFRMDRDQQKRAGARSAPRRGAAGRMFAEGARSESEVAPRRLVEPGQPATARAGFSSEDEACDASLAGTGDVGAEDAGEWMRVYPGDDVNSVGLPRSVGDGIEDPFVSDGGFGGVGELGDTGSVY